MARDKRFVTRSMNPLAPQGKLFFFVVKIENVEKNLFLGCPQKTVISQKYCACPFVRYFHKLFWDDIMIIC